MYDDYDENQRASLEQETVDFTVKVPIRDLIDLVADEAYRPEGEYSIRDISPVDVWSYLGPAAALTALKDHGWFFESHHVGRKWVEAALMQSDDDKFARPIASSLYEKAKRLVILDETGTPRTIAAESTGTDKRTEAPNRTLAFLTLESALRLDMLEDDAIGENARIVAEAACSAAETLSQVEKDELRSALSNARPHVERLNFDADELPELLADFSEGLTRRSRQLFRAATETCHPNFAWVAISGLDMIGELLAQVSTIQAEAA